MRGRHHAPGEVWDAGGVGEGGGPGDHDGLPAAYRDLPQIPRVSKRHHQNHQKSTSPRILHLIISFQRSEKS